MDAESACSVLTKLYLILQHLKSMQLFAEILNFYMNKQNVSQTALAKALNVDPSTVAHWRKNRRLPENAGIVFLIAKALMLTSRQRQYLLFSWFIQKDHIDLAPYIETAIREGDDSR